MAAKSMTVRDFNDPDSRPSLALTPLAIEDLTDTPVYTLTPAAHEALDQDRQQACADVLLHELHRYPSSQLAFAENFKNAYQAYDAYRVSSRSDDLDAMRKQWSEACETMFFQLKAIFELATREESL